MGKKNRKNEKMIMLSEDLDKLLDQHLIYIEPIGIYQLQNWIDWLIMKMQRAVKKEDVIKAVEHFEENWNW